MHICISVFNWPGPPVTGDESLSEAGTTWILGAGCLAFLNFENMPNTNE